MIQYRGSAFVGWTGDFLLAGLVQQGLVRVRLAGNQASEVARVDLGSRTAKWRKARGDRFGSCATETVGRWWY